jgi:hypothetical protein
LAETVHFAEKNPDKTKLAVGKALKITDADSLQSAYDAYAKALVNRRLTIPANAVTEAVEVAREGGATIKKKPADLFENSLAEHLEKSGFLKDLWGAELQKAK